LADVEEEIKRRLDGLSPYLNMLQAKMKDISSGAPHLTAKYYAEFSQIMADAGMSIISPHVIRALFNSALQNVCNMNSQSLR